MRQRRIPSEIVRFADRMLTGHHTQLKFNDTVSDWISVDNGIGQGDPFSMITYIVYCADLTDIANSRDGETALAFVDDTAFITVGKSFEDTHAKLRNMMERSDGALRWSADHYSRFEVNKFALLDFSKNRSLEHLPLHIGNKLIIPTDHHKFLGLIVDSELTWTKHANFAIAKGTEYVLQLRQLSNITTGISTRLMRKLYLTVAIPK